MGEGGFEIRMATRADAPGVAAIYAPIVSETAISFEYEPPTVKEMGRRIETTLRTHPWLVAVNGGVVGYAYAARHRERAAYAWSVDASAYVAEEWQGRGVGRALYETLVNDLRGRGFVTAFAGITLPNEASVALHEGVGFEPIGVFSAVGYKLGRWHDVGWWRLALRDELPVDPEPPASGRRGPLR